MQTSIPATYTPCCCDLDCKSFQHTLNLLRTWGLDTTLHGSGLHLHFVLAIPDYWNSFRRERFAEGLSLIAQQNERNHKK